MSTKTAGWQMSEGDLLRTVLEMCQALHLHTAHFRPAQTTKGWRTAVSGDGKGFPDLVIVGQGVMYRELKSENGRLAPEQRVWRQALTAAGMDVGVWRPRDLADGRIEMELRALTRRSS